MRARVAKKVYRRQKSEAGRYRRSTVRRAFARYAWPAFVRANKNAGGPSVDNVLRWWLP